MKLRRLMQRPDGRPSLIIPVIVVALAAVTIIGACVAILMRNPSPC